MHIPDGFLDLKTWGSLTAVSGAGIALALRKIKRDETYPVKIPMIGMVAAFIFAAQMINFPVAGATSGHLDGAALASILFGPWIGMLIMATVVVIQALFFQDGGITAIGANIFNMGVLASLTGYGIYSLFGRWRNKWIRTVSAFFAAWASVVVAAAAASMELAVSGTAPVAVALKAMLGWHALIGIGEGIVTSFMLLYFAESNAASAMLRERRQVQ